LGAAVLLMAQTFKQHGYKIPVVRVACGWPSSGGLGKKKRTIGQCWDTVASSDGLHQSFISPYLAGKYGEEADVLPTLVHEVCHAVVGINQKHNKVVGINQKHNKVFGKCARAVGLEGKLTATVAGERLLVDCKDWSIQLGEYPHAQLDPKKSPVKKQTTRLVKCECSECGYVCRTTKKWLEFGAPLCPQKHGPMQFDDSILEDESEGE